MAGAVTRGQCLEIFKFQTGQIGQEKYSLDRATKNQTRSQLYSIAITYETLFAARRSSSF